MVVLSSDMFTVGDGWLGAVQNYSLPLIFAIHPKGNGPGSGVLARHTFGRDRANPDGKSGGDRQSAHQAFTRRSVGNHGRGLK